VTNLIDNAVHHNIPGGDVQVTTATSGGRAVLSVTNSGQVIPPGEVDRMLQPFQRLGPRRARRDGHGHGHGLGLSIVGAIATAHGATITPHAQPSGGLAIDITFPPPPFHRPHGRTPGEQFPGRPSALRRPQGQDRITHSAVLGNGRQL
jgi:signal transduction histidine kinase